MNGAPHAVNAEAIRTLAAEILQRPEYAAAREPEAMDWFTRWWGLLADLLRQLEGYFAWLEALRSSSPVLYGLLYAGLLIVLVLLIAHMSWAISRALRGSTAPEPSRGAAPLFDFLGPSRGLALEGRYLEAAHRLLLACLQRSAHAGLIELHPEDTNRKVCERFEVARLPGTLRAELLELVRLTERAWFRDRVDDPVLYERWAAAYGRLVEATE